MTKPLAEKAVIVTGAGRGLGRAYALAIAGQGAQVVVNDVDVEEAERACAEIRRAGGRAVVSGDSVASPSGAAALVKACQDSFGGIDGLVNNAGLFFHGPAHEVDLDMASALISVNLLGVLNCGVAAMRAMTPERPGTIINVTSGASLGIGGMSVYGASKAGVSALTTHWAIEQPNGVSVIGLSPIADTRMNEDFRTPIRILPEEIAPLVAFLVSDAARAFNGHTIRLAKQELSMLNPAAFSNAVAWNAEWDHAHIASAIQRLIAG